jgi:hypothetical protein
MLAGSASNVNRGTAEAALRRKDNYFYTAMSVAIAVSVFAGFAESFYLRSYFRRPELHLVAEIHGVVNTCWILLFVIQNALIATGRVAFHRRLGWAGAALSLLIVPAGIATGVDAARHGHHINSPDIYASLLIFSFRNTLIFALLMAAAVYFRNKPATHKRLALLAAVALFSEPAIGRIPGLAFPMIVLLVLAFLFAGPIWDLVTRRRIHSVYLWAVPTILILSPLTPVMVIVSRTSAWHNFTDWLIR